MGEEKRSSPLILSNEKKNKEEEGTIFFPRRKISAKINIDDLFDRYDIRRSHSKTKNIEEQWPTK